MYQVILSDIDVARVIAALRLLQDRSNGDINDILTDGERYPMPSAEELDVLCDRVNFAEKVGQDLNISAPMPDEGQRIAYMCPECGSDDICSDAAARWNKDLQAWELAGVHDNSTCQECSHDADHGFEVTL